MSFLTQAFTSESPLWACHYGITTHPLYQKCLECPDLLKCPQLYDWTEVMKELNFEVDNCDGKCIKCRGVGKCKKLFDCKLNLITSSGL